MAATRHISTDLVVIFCAVTFVGTAVLLVMKASSDALCVWRPDAGCVIGPGLPLDAECDPCRQKRTPVSCALARPCDEWRVCGWGGAACITDGGELTRALASVNRTCVIAEDVGEMVDTGCGSLESAWACDHGNAAVSEALRVMMSCESSPQDVSPQDFDSPPNTYMAVA